MKYLGLAAICGLLVAAPAMRAGTLDFSGNICSASADGSGASVACGDYSPINQSYGDTGTVNVTYKDLINPGNSLKFWTTGYNNLVNVAWGGNGDANGASSDRIEIAPTAGQTITLDSFDLGAYLNTQRVSNVVIYDLLGNVLLNYGNVLIGSAGGTTATSFAPNVSSANGIAITWKDSGYNNGIDNIVYSESATPIVPEPSSLILLGTGALGMLGGLRRRLRA